MRAWAVRSPAPIAGGPMALVARESPSPGEREVVVEAERAVVDEAYAYALPEQFGDEDAAPLLCDVGAAWVGGAPDRPPVPLDVASRIGICVETTAYGFDEADRALLDLAEDRLRGAAVMVR